MISYVCQMQGLTCDVRRIRKPGRQVNSHLRLSVHRNPTTRDEVGCPSTRSPEYYNTRTRFTTRFTRFWIL
jgi:hypothetical protein